MSKVALGCFVPATFGDWSTCTKSCNGGSQYRARANVEPSFGGKACPHYTETQPCNVHECDCQTAGGSKAHGARYAGFGKNYCNQCVCHTGMEVCTTRERDAQWPLTTEQPCESDGLRF